MDHEPNQTDIKKPYKPPQVTTVSLRPEEAVLGHCKISTAGGPVSLSSCTALGACNSIGS